MSTRTRSRNAWASNLAGSLLSGGTSVDVDSASGLVAPLYLVIAPNDVNAREFVRVGTVNTNTLSSITRALDGSAAGAPFTHAAGTEIRAVPVHQHLEDIFDDIEQNETDITTNAGNIATNTSAIATNTADIATNTSDIATNASDITTNAGNLTSHAADADAHHSEAHTVASHSDTTATGAELETLTGGGDADSLHTHDGKQAAQVNYSESLSLDGSSGSPSGISYDESSITGQGIGSFFKAHGLLQVSSVSGAGTGDVIVTVSSGFPSMPSGPGYWTSGILAGLCRVYTVSGGVFFGIYAVEIQSSTSFKLVDMSDGSYLAWTDITTSPKVFEIFVWN